MFQSDLGTLYLGDAEEILPQLNGGEFHLIFTDPPYPRQYFHCYEILANNAYRLLKIGGSLITILPTYNIPNTINLFKDLKWRWMLHISQFSGKHARMLMGIEVTYKPMGWWVKEKYRYDKTKDFTKDGVEITLKDGQDKKQHKWKQSLQWAEYYVRKTTQEGDLVLDPFVGSGTVAYACEKLNRRWIAIDIDKKSYDLTKERIETYLGLYF